MKLSRRTVIILSVALLGSVALLAALLTPSKPAPSIPTVLPSLTATPTPDSLSEADRQLLTALSSELAAKYRTFAKPDAAYLATLRPYLTPQFYEDYQSTLRYADRVSFLKPVRSSSRETSLRGTATGQATALVQLDSVDLDTAKQFRQTVQIQWKKSGDRWSAADIQIVKLDKEVGNG